MRIGRGPHEPRYVPHPHTLTGGDRCGATFCPSYLRSRSSSWPSRRLLRRPRSRRDLLRCLVGARPLRGVRPAAPSRPVPAGADRGREPVALAAWTAIGAQWSGSVGRTLLEATRTLGYAGVLLLVVWTFGPRGWRWAALGLTATAITVCSLALASRLLPGLTSRTGPDRLRHATFELPVQLLECGRYLGRDDGWPRAGVEPPTRHAGGGGHCPWAGCASRFPSPI